MKNKIEYEMNPRSGHVFTKCPWNKKDDGITVGVGTYPCFKCEHRIKMTKEEKLIMGKRKYIFCACEKKIKNGIFGLLFG
jgi:hypothetical protein